MRALSCALFVSLVAAACGGGSRAQLDDPGSREVEPTPGDPAAPSDDAEPAPMTAETDPGPATPDRRTGREYVACGCGCCGAPPEGEVACVDSEAALEEIIATDRQASQNPQCAVVGCAIGTRYAVCE